MSEHHEIIQEAFECELSRAPQILCAPDPRKNSSITNDLVWRGWWSCGRTTARRQGWNPASPGEHQSSPLAPGSARFGPKPRPRHASNSSANRPRRKHQRGHPKACSIRGLPSSPLSRPPSASATAAKTCPSSLASPLRASPTHVSQWLFGDWGRAGRRAGEPGPASGVAAPGTQRGPRRGGRPPARGGVRACLWLPACGILGRSRKDDEE